MSDTLQRMAKSGGQIPLSAPDTLLRRALRRAADRELGLDLSVEDVSAQTPDLSEFLDGLAPEELVIGLERGGALAGVVVLSRPLWSAAVEMQTVGRVLSKGGRDRVATRTDAALCGPLVTRLLDEITATDSGTTIQGWCDGLRLGDQVTLRRVVELTLPAGLVRQIRLNCSFGDGGADTYLTLASVAPPDRANSEEPAADALWQQSWQATASMAPAVLVAVLHRMPLPLSVLEALEPGQVLPLDGACVTGLRLETPTGRLVCEARLGRVGGSRAARLERPVAREMEDIGLGAPPPMGGSGAMPGPPAIGDLGLPEPSADPDLPSPPALDLPMGGDAPPAPMDDLPGIEMPGLDDSAVGGLPEIDLPDPGGGGLPDLDLGGLGDGGSDAGGELPDLDAIDFGDLPPLD